MNEVYLGTTKIEKSSFDADSVDYVLSLGYTKKVERVLKYRLLVCWSNAPSTMLSAKRVELGILTPVRPINWNSIILQITKSFLWESPIQIL